MLVIRPNEANAFILMIFAPAGLQASFITVEWQMTVGEAVDRQSIFA
jgi:hypothetical protein